MTIYIAIKIEFNIGHMSTNTSNISKQYNLETQIAYDFLFF